jgi:lipopolysaccharide/colanic/teichoic acid biosynthesis glycosyltransferase
MNKTIRFDGIFAAAATLLLLPVYAFVASAIWIIDRQRPIFVQYRIGKDGLFKCYKFRTMLPAIREVPPGLSGTQAQAFESYRETRLGKLLRKFKIDELPQLWNIVKGDMNFVGIRPRSEEQYWDALPIQWQFNLRPGLTGIDQVSTLRRWTTYELSDFIRFDSFYHQKRKNKSFCERALWDLEILFLKTPKAIFAAQKKEISLMPKSKKTAPSMHSFEEAMA